MHMHLSRAAKSLIRRIQKTTVVSRFAQKYLKINESARFRVMKSQDFGKFQLFFPENEMPNRNEKGKSMIEMLDDYNHHNNFDCVLYKDSALTNRLNFLLFVNY